MDVKPEYLKLPIIIDIGSGIIKAGISGQDSPKTIFQNYIGEPKYLKVLRSFTKDNQEMQEQYIGSDCTKYLGILKLRYPVKNGIFENEQDILTVFKYIFQKLEIDNEEIREHPILITEPLLNPYSNREKIASALFENLSAPAIFFGSQPILSLFSTSNTNGIILESGEGVTQSCVVYEGYSIPNSFIRNNYGGRDVTEYFKILLKRQGYNFNTSSEFEIVRKMKEEICFTAINSTSNNPLSNMSNNIEISNNKNKNEISGNTYNLPDGNSIKIGEEKSLAPEILFNPSIIGSEFLSFQEMIVTSINKCDIDIRKSLYSNVLISGGNTLFKGIQEKFHTEIKYLAPKNMKVKVHTPNNRLFCCWTGGNVISTLEIFKKMWVSREEWMEKGNKSLIHVKTI
jgi:centractin